MNHTVSDHQPKAVAIIPARYASTRLPGKPLLDLAGRPMIVHVVERALAARNVARALVATDDERIAEAVRAAGFEAVMTRADHASGSDRLAEVAAALDDADVIVNVQGDEPLISPQTIERAVDELVNDEEAQIVTTCERIERAADVLSPDVVKVVMDAGGRALYFSRQAIPYPRDAVCRFGSLEAALASEPRLLERFRKHTGLYAYRRAFLLEYTGWPRSPLEMAEELEQLRALERGVTIRVIETTEPSIGVDTMEDLERVRALLNEVPSDEWQVTS
ncbi:MAG TPA: 3-deoxy-manno-octulosonate cytidylyltransferase [Pyrinomonadaceae bacterium]|nr:3-deoxy-manno-octulosonate cytidylyltransferase [Pyrinomonadaceae bacterium]